MRLKRERVFFFEKSFLFKTHAGDNYIRTTKTVNNKKDYEKVYIYHLEDP